MSNLGDRYIKVRLTSADGTKVSWAVRDIATDDYVMDERKPHGGKGKTRRRFWQGTEEDADHYCGLLNKRYRDSNSLAATLLDQLSGSQRIHFKVLAETKRAERANRKVSHSGSGRRNSGGVEGFKSPFRRCDACGKSVREGHVC